MDAGVIGKGKCVSIQVTHFFLSFTLASARTKFSHLENGDSTFFIRLKCLNEVIVPCGRRARRP